MLDTAGLWISALTNIGEDTEVNEDSPYVEFMSQVAVSKKMVTAILYQESTFWNKL